MTCAVQWNQAQEARVKCADAWAKAGELSHEKKVALLKEYLVTPHGFQPWSWLDLYATSLLS